MKQLVKLVGVIGIIGAIYLAPSSKALASCGPWELYTSNIECISGVKYYQRILTKTCVDSTGINITFDNDSYPIGYC